jgi:hypothetical protein
VAVFATFDAALHATALEGFVRVWINDCAGHHIGIPDYWPAWVC